MRWNERLAAVIQTHQSYVCVGLDPDLTRLPAGLSRDPEGLYQFCTSIMEATIDLVAAFKPNIAFFEALGLPGIQVLMRLMQHQHRVPMIIDAKRGDIGSTAEAYATALFEQLGADAVTLNPYLGSDSLEPFLRHAERGAFLLCKTSNPGSADLQDLMVDGEPLYLRVAQLASTRWNSNANVGLVVGATHPQALAAVRERCPTLPLLVPGVGAQGGELAAAARAATGSAAGCMLINASRTILYASAGSDYAAAARTEATRLRDAINQALSQ